MKRKKAIKLMYDYEGKIPRAKILPRTGEVIYNWYVCGYPTIEDLDKPWGDGTKAYDAKYLDTKIMAKDMV